MKNFHPLTTVSTKMPSKPKTKRKEVPETKRATIITCCKAGKSNSQISTLEALLCSTVYTIICCAQFRPEHLTANQKHTEYS